MLTLAFALLCGAALLGSGLAALYFRGPQAKPPPAPLLAAHAFFGAASLVALLLALRRGLPVSHFGTAGFGSTAAALLGLALALGLATAPAAWRRRRPAEPLVGAHAALAIAGLVVLLALVVLR